jgi:hypothetical protein
LILYVYFIIEKKFIKNLPSLHLKKNKVQDSEVVSFMSKSEHGRNATGIYSSPLIQ